MDKKYGIYNEKHMNDVIYLAYGNGHYKPAVYTDIDEAIKICNIINENPSRLHTKHVVAEFRILPCIVVSIISSDQYHRADAEAI